MSSGVKVVYGRTMPDSSRRVHKQPHALSRGATSDILTEWRGHLGGRGAGFFKQITAAYIRVTLFFFFFSGVGLGLAKFSWLGMHEIFLNISGWRARERYERSLRSD